MRRALLISGICYQQSRRIRNWQSRLPKTVWLGMLTIMTAIGVMAVASVLSTSGCVEPPPRTILVDTDGDGKVDALAPDKDGDGKPDKDPNGEILIIPGSQGYKAAAIADSTGPHLLSWLGGFLGLPVLIIASAAWKGGRFGHVLMNTIMSVQAARERLDKAGDKKMTAAEALVMVDEALAAKQPAKTIAYIKKVKADLGLTLDTPAGRQVPVDAPGG